MCIPAGDGIGVVTGRDGRLAVSLYGSLPVVVTTSTWELVGPSPDPRPSQPRVERFAAAR